MKKKITHPAQQELRKLRKNDLITESSWYKVPVAAPPKKYGMALKTKKR